MEQQPSPPPFHYQDFAQRTAYLSEEGATSEPKDAEAQPSAEYGAEALSPSAVKYAKALNFLERGAGVLPFMAGDPDDETPASVKSPTEYTTAMENHVESPPCSVVDDSGQAGGCIGCPNRPSYAQCVGGAADALGQTRSGEIAACSTRAQYGRDGDADVVRPGILENARAVFDGGCDALGRFRNNGAISASSTRAQYGWNPDANVVKPRFLRNKWALIGVGSYVSGRASSATTIAPMSAINEQVGRMHDTDVEKAGFLPRTWAFFGWDINALGGTPSGVTSKQVGRSKDADGAKAGFLRTKWALFRGAADGVERFPAGTIDRPVGRSGDDDPGDDPDDSRTFFFSKWTLFVVGNLISAAVVVSEISQAKFIFDEYLRESVNNVVEGGDRSARENECDHADLLRFLVMFTLVFGLLTELFFAVGLSLIYRSPLDIKSSRKVPRDAQPCGSLLMVNVFAPFSWGIIYASGGIVGLRLDAVSSCVIGSGEPALKMYLYYSSLYMLFVGLKMLGISIFMFFFSCGSPAKSTEHCCAAVGVFYGHRILSIAAFLDLFWQLQGSVWLYRVGGVDLAAFIVLCSCGVVGGILASFGSREPDVVEEVVGPLPLVITRPPTTSGTK